MMKCGREFERQEEAVTAKGRCLGNALVKCARVQVDMCEEKRDSDASSEAEGSK